MTELRIPNYRFMTPTLVAAVRLGFVLLNQPTRMIAGFDAATIAPQNSPMEFQQCAEGG